MARKVDQLGRVVLPAELRRQLGIREGDLVEISIEDERVVLERVESRCVFCGATADLRQHRDRLVCASCVRDLSTG